MTRLVLQVGAMELLAGAVDAEKVRFFTKEHIGTRGDALTLALSLPERGYHIILGGSPRCDDCGASIGMRTAGTLGCGYTCNCSHWRRNDSEYHWWSLAIERSGDAQAREIVFPLARELPKGLTDEQLAALVDLYKEGRK